MKLALIVFVAIAAVATGASFDNRRSRSTGVDLDSTGASAGGKGQHVAAKTVVVETKSGRYAEGAASATQGEVRSSSGIESIIMRKSGGEGNARAQRGV